MDHEMLVDAAIQLRNDLVAANTKIQELEKLNGNALQAISGNRQFDAAFTPERVAEKAKQMRELCVKGVKKQMKWQPSCKNGTTKWSFEGIVPNQDVFYAMFGFSDVKPFKLKKVATLDFEKLFGCISASCRYNYLSITGATVNVHWDGENNTFKISGTYGI